LSVGYRGKLWPIEDVFYKWFRCEIVHAGGLPVDIAFIDDVEPGTLSVRAGGAPNYLPTGLPRVVRSAALVGARLTACGLLQRSR